MQLDIAILIIIALFGVLGFKNGLLYTLSQTFGWLIAIAVAFFTLGSVVTFFKDHSTLYDSYYLNILKICNGIAAKIADSAGAQMGGLIAIHGEEVARTAAVKVANATFNVLIFLGIVLVVKILLYVIFRLIVKNREKGFIGGFDAAAGLILGLAQGLVVVFVLLLLLLPAAFAINPSIFVKMQGWLDNSFIAGMLYLNNPLYMLIDGYSPDILKIETWFPNMGNTDYSMKDWDNLI